MTDNTVKSEVPLELPEDDNPLQTVSRRKTIYRPGVDNEFVVETPGGDVRGFFHFKAARLIQMSAREQETEKGKSLVVSQAIIIDDPLVGILDEDGNRRIHPMFADPRYANWANSDRPKRVNGQQWVQPDNAGMLKEYGNYLRENCGFRVDLNPRPRPGSDRKTTDLLRALPINRDQSDPTSYGVQLSAFEVTTNPDYAPGFTDFFSGVTEQQQRWESAVKLEDPEARKEFFRQIVANIHYLGGVYHDNSAWWARPVDVGMIEIDGHQLPLYSSHGQEITDDVFSGLYTSTTSPSGSSEGAGASTGGSSFDAMAADFAAAEAEAMAEENKTASV